MVATETARPAHRSVESARIGPRSASGSCARVLDDAPA
ncbi:hypothetical protein DB32_004187 [Sandaracinus amylolyticus]|uniref:Uncharacterized protein n=1 Tax=Sandaracinus amylolyticus TaxID=927083 RepID=A0A0F6YIR2_9BACT|nr:hypothetical protein DB32_004187 [Sandaracinus amylolyticus]